MSTELFQLSATELAARVRSRQVSCREVIEAHAERIRLVNPRVNAITVSLESAALALADRMDREGPTGALAGVPFTVKESLDCVGTCSACLAWHCPSARPTTVCPAVC